MNLSIPKLNTILICFGVFFSQFYFLKSGLPQISHIIIAISLFLFFFNDLDKIKINSVVQFLFLFILYVLLVNFIWMVFYVDYTYLISSIYWLFNFLFFILICNFNKKESEAYKKYILRLIVFSFFLELLFFILNLGRYDFYPRYNGFFNDPNQMAFWVLCCLAIFFMFSQKKYVNMIVFVMGLVLIVSTMSRSAFLGLCFVALGFLFKQKGGLYKKILSFLSFVFLFFIFLYFAYIKGFFDELFKRFRFGIEDAEMQTESRGLNIIFSYPEYIFFGAGQGNYGLFSKTNNEIHSTWIGILFYYGIIGFILFAIFLYKIFKDLSISDKLLFLAPMVYGFTTYSARTSIFWIFLSLVVLLKKDFTVKK